MITLQKSVQITGGVAPYEYVWISEVVGCAVSFTNQSGTSLDGIVTTEITFNTSDCISQVKLYVKDSIGCENIYPITITSPCANYSIDSVSESLSGTQLTITALDTGGDLSYNWVWDHDFFEEISIINNVLVLNVKTDRPDDSSSLIYIYATSPEGCPLSYNHLHTFCTPQAGNITVQMCRQIIGGSGEMPVCLEAKECRNAIDYSTLSLTFLLTGSTYFTWTNDGSGCITLLAGANTPVGNYTAVWQAEDLQGNLSTLGNIFIEFTICKERSSCINAPQAIRRFLCPELVGLPQSIEIVDLDDYVNVNNDCVIEWESFLFIAMTGQVAAGVGETASLTTPFGVVNFNSDHEIIYTVNAPPTGTETIQYTVLSVSGESTGIVEIVVINECIAGPVAVADAYCQSCVAPYAYQTVLSNDTGTGIVPSSIIITSFPTDGFVNINYVAGTIQYVPDVGFSGVDTYDYKVANTSGIYSNTITVTMTIDCPDSGLDTLLSYCNSSGVAFNLKDTINSGDAGGAWTLTGTPTGGAQTFNVGGAPLLYNIGDPVGATDNPAVTLVDTVSDAGIYEFTYTVTGACSTSTTTLTVTAYEVNIVQVNQTCNYAVAAENPDTGTNLWHAVVTADSEIITETVRIIVTTDCPIAGTELVNFIATDTRTYTTRKYQQGVVGNRFVVGGHFSTVRVYHTNGTVNTLFDIDISPTTTYTTGCAGAVNTANLTFDGSNYNLMALAVKQVIQNAVCTTFAGTTMNSMSLDASITSVGDFTLAFHNKHAPTTHWVGIEVTDPSITWDTNGATPKASVTANHSTTVLPGSSALRVEYITDACSAISGVAFKVGLLVNSPTTSFDNIILLGTATIAVGADGSPTSVACAEAELTAAINPVCTTTTYAWSSGSTSNPVILLQGSGLYTVTATCTSLACTPTRNITI